MTVLTLEKRMQETGPVADLSALERQFALEFDDGRERVVPGVTDHQAGAVGGGALRLASEESFVRFYRQSGPAASIALAAAGSIAKSNW